MTGLPAPHIRAAYRFIWDLTRDNVQQGTVQVQMTPSRSGVKGVPATVQFDVTPAGATQLSLLLPAAPAPAPAITPKITLVSGDAQTGVSGQFLPTPLVVQVNDGTAQAQPISGARVEFVVGAGSPAVVLESRFDAPTSYVTNPVGLGVLGGLVTDGTGQASVFVRALPGSMGPGTIEARIVGSSAAPLIIHFTLAVPALKTRFQPQPWPATPPSSIDPYVLTFFYVYIDQVLYQPDARNPVVLSVTASPGIVVCTPNPRITGANNDWDNLNGCLVAIMATSGGFTGEVTITCVSDPSIAAPPPLQIPVNAIPDTSFQHMTRASFDPSTGDQFTNVTMKLVLTRTQANVTAPGGLTGYPGLKLSESLGLIVSDGQQTYDMQFVPDPASGLSYALPASEQPVTRPLQLLYTGNGTFSSPNNPDSLNSISVQAGSDVYFEPSGAGPWVVRAGLDPTNPGSIMLPVPVTYTLHTQDSFGNWTVEGTFDQWGLEGAPAGVVFVILEPQQVSLLARIGSDPPQAYNTVHLDHFVHSGDRLLVQISGLSPVSGGAPAPWILTDGTTNIAMTLDGNTLTSEDVVMLPNNPDVSPPSNVKTQVAYENSALSWGVQGFESGLGGNVTASTLGLFPVVAPRIYSRKPSGPPAPQESLLGSTPFGGFGATVNLRSGAFLYSVCDLEVPTGVGPLRFIRTFRGQTRSNGPLGPGWFLNHAAFLDQDRYCDGTGREICTSESPAYPPVMALDNALSDESGGELHFYSDGSLKLSKDRFNNQIKYSYNQQGQLAQITDPHGRIFTLTYYLPSDSGVVLETVGKLKTVTDFANRPIDFEYYTAADSDGKPGWLKTVRLPPCDTLLPGADTAAPYRRSETYKYAVNPNDPLDGELLEILEILDSQQKTKKTILTNVYQSNQVKMQQCGNAAIQFQYDPPVAPPPPPPAPGAPAPPNGWTTRVTNGRSEVTVYMFADSRFADGAAPVQIMRKGNAAAARPDLTDSFTHDRMARPTNVTSAAGDAFTISYQDSQIQLVPYQIQWTTPANELRQWNIRYQTNSPWLVNCVVEPRGNVTGVNQEIFATRYYYVTDANGLTTLDHIEPPPTLRMAVVAAADQSQAYSSTRALTQYQWNKYGLVSKITDAQGVVTSYSYYPYNDPTGAAGGAPSPSEGGLLAQVQRDVQDANAAPLRQSWFGADNSPVPMTTSWQYNNTGALVSITDAFGIQHTLAPNQLGEITGVTAAAASPGAPPLSITRNFDYDWRGLMARTVLGAAGLTDTLSYDDVGLFSSLGQSSSDGTATTRLVLDANNDVKKLRPAELESGRFPTCGSEVVLDERGLLLNSLEGTAATNDPAAGAALLTTQYGRSPGGLVNALTAPGNFTYRLFQNGFGESHAAAGPAGDAVQWLAESTGVVSRAIAFAGNGAPLQPSDGLPAIQAKPVAGFVETFHNELGLPYRYHQGLFAIPDPADTSPQPPSQPVTAPPEYLGPMESMASGNTWPPVTSTNVVDGARGTGDGRRTYDRLHDAYGLPSRMVADNLDFADIRRDGHGRPIEVVDSSGGSAKYTYDPHGQVDQVTYTVPASDGSITKTFKYEYEFDAVGRPVRRSDGRGHSVYSSYAPDGTVSGFADAQNSQTSASPTGLAINLPGNTTTFKRDGYGRLRNTQLQLISGGTLAAGGTPDTNVYNASGVVGLQFDYEDEPAPAIALAAIAAAPGAGAADPAASVPPPQTALYAGFALRFLTDQAENTTQFDYDDNGRLLKITYPPCAASGKSPTSYSFQFDPTTGRLASCTDANGSVLTYAWDPQERFAGMNATTVGAGVDSNQGDGCAISYLPGVTVSTVNQNSYSCRVADDSCSGVHRETQGQNAVLTARLTNGRTVTYPPVNGVAKQVTYTYDSSGRLVSVMDGANVVASFVYLGRSRLLSRTVRAISTTYTSDDLVPLTVGIGVSGLIAGGPQAVQYALAHDNSNRITSRTRTAGAVSETRTWTYDSAGRIVNETRQPGGAATQRLYDGDTVLRQEIVQTGGTVQKNVVRAREERGRIVSVTNQLTGAVTAYAYDLNGNLIDDGRQQYKYDVWNRLTRVLSGGTTVATFAYDAFNRCVSRTDATGSVETYIYNGWHLIQVWVNGVPTEQYIYGDDDIDDLLTVEVGGTRYTFLYTPEGWIDGLADDQGNLIERYDYDLHGNVTVLGPSASPLLDASGNPAVPRSRFLFQRRPYDPVPGLFNYRMRYYSPWDGQFFTADPARFANGPNHYGLSHGDPVNFADPYGMQEKPQREDPFNLGEPLEKKGETRDPLHTPALLPSLSQLLLGASREHVDQLRDRMLDSILLRDVRGHWPELEEPFKVTEYVRNARLSGKIFWDYEKNAPAPVALRLFFTEDGPVAYVARGENRMVTAVEVLGDKATLRDLKGYWTIEEPVKDARRAINAFSSPITIGHHVEGYREFLKTGQKTKSISGAELQKWSEVRIATEAKGVPPSAPKSFFGSVLRGAGVILQGIAIGEAISAVREHGLGSWDAADAITDAIPYVSTGKLLARAADAPRKTLVYIIETPNVKRVDHPVPAGQQADPDSVFGSDYHYETKFGTQISPSAYRRYMQLRSR
jgi:RHS repeat-associated protein